nr:hypothetical protein Iba_chr01fCG10060 [Ipomoea batatas]
MDWRPHHAGNDGGDCGGGEVAVVAVADGGEATVGCSGGDEAVVAGTKAMQLLQAIDGVAVQLRQRRHGSPRRIAAGGCRRRCSGASTAVLGGGSCGGGKPAVAVAVAASGSTAVPGGGSCVGSVSEAIPTVAGDGGLLSYSR